MLSVGELDTVYATETEGGTYHTILCRAKLWDNLKPMSRSRARIAWGKKPCRRCVADDFGHRDLGI